MEAGKLTYAVYEPPGLRDKIEDGTRRVEALCLDWYIWRRGERWGALCEEYQWGDAPTQFEASSRDEVEARIAAFMRGVFIGKRQANG